MGVQSGPTLYLGHGALPDVGGHRELRLRRRSDAFGQAMDAYEHDPHGDAETREETLEVLRGAHKEANEQLRRYRAEVGLPDFPTRKNAGKPA